MRYAYSDISANNSLVDVFFEIIATPEKEVQKDLILPDCTPGLMFIEESGFLRNSRQSSVHLKPGAVYLFGQKTKAVEYSFNPTRFQGFGVKLKPASVFALFGIDAAEITDKVIDIQDIVGRMDHYIEPFYAQEPSAKSRQELMLNFFKKEPLTKEAPLLNVLLNDIHASKGELSIHLLSQKYRRGYKNIERLFKRHVGLTPKCYARIVRFYQCVLTGVKSEKPRLTDVGYQSGFFDQNHFIKETKNITGQTPSQIFGKAAHAFEKQQLAYLSRRGY